jgi:RNA polymerase sigma-70 factor (ECF subfamily)
MRRDDEEERLIAAAVAGDRVALGELLMANWDPLALHIAHQLPATISGVISVDDILQETLVRAIRSAAQFKSRNNASFGAWLRIIADHTLQSALKARAAKKRGRARRQSFATWENQSASSLTDLVRLVPDRDSSPSSKAAQDESLRAMRVGLASLADADQRALSLRYLRGQSLDEMSAILGRSPAAVRGLLYRAKIRLRNALGDSSRWFGRK